MGSEARAKVDKKTWWFRCPSLWAHAALTLLLSESVGRMSTVAIQAHLYFAPHPSDQLELHIIYSDIQECT